MDRRITPGVASQRATRTKRPHPAALDSDECVLCDYYLEKSDNKCAVHQEILPREVLVRMPTAKSNKLKLSDIPIHDREAEKNGDTPAA